MSRSKEQFLDVSCLSSDLKGRSVRGVLNTVTSNGVRLFVRTVAAIVLARLVAPEHYGIIGMITVFTALAHLLQDLGLAQATIQRRNVSHEQVSSIFWINTAVGVVLMLIVALSGPALARFYGESRLVLPTLVLSLGFLFGGIAVEHRALLQRQMRFAALAKTEITASLGGAVAGVGVALQMGDYWALVAMNMTIQLMRTVGVWIACPWRPSMPKRCGGVMDLIRFGAGLTGHRFVNYLFRRADKLLIGRFHGAVALGFYSKAYSLLMLPISEVRTPVMQVAMPVLCSLLEQPARYLRYYRKIVFVTALLSMPIVGYLLVYSENIIVMLLGSRWHPSARLFNILAVTAFIQSVATIGLGVPMVSQGLVRRYFWCGFLNAIITCTTMSVGVRWGAIGVAYGYAVSTYLFLGPSLAIFLRKTPVAMRDWIDAVWRPAFASLIMIAVMAGWSRYVLPGFCVLEASPSQHATVLLSGGIVGAAVFFVIMFLLPQGRHDLIHVCIALRETISRTLPGKGNTNGQ